ncbi:hypothetical protein [Rhodoferax sp.]|uniref:hypothetical protein n=1 Tax=Rhodoferax sp. TaxID=50421 RepID=UPI00374DDD88
MRTTLVRPKPMPARREREAWWSAVVWLVFCVAMVGVGVFLTPRIGAAYASEDLLIPPTPGTTLVSEIVESAVPMAATVLYPNELTDPHALPVVSKR